MPCLAPDCQVQHAKVRHCRQHPRRWQSRQPWVWASVHERHGSGECASHFALAHSEATNRCTDAKADTSAAAVLTRAHAVTCAGVARRLDVHRPKRRVDQGRARCGAGRA